MATPHIEEWLKEIKSAIPQKDSATELTDWWQFDRVVKDVLTQAHQTGIDKAVERIVAIDIPKDGTDFEMAQLRYREKVIKALQDNK